MPKILAVITARGGSKGLVRKNVLDLAGMPLIAWTIQAAKQSKYIDKVILSSDDDEIIAVAEQYGCEVPFRRPAALATDEASSLDVLFHAIEQVPEYDYVIVLQPTSPLRTSTDIDNAFEMMILSEADACASVCEVAKTPYWMYSLGPNKVLNRLLPMPTGGHRRQALPTAYELNGAIYLIKIESLYTEKSLTPEQTIAFEMSRERSIDIDCLLDFQKCETYLDQESHDETRCSPTI